MMGIVIPFNRFTEITCLSAEQTEIRDTLIETMSACTRCDDRGWIFFRRTDGKPDVLPCPCGGSDRSRIGSPDFGGAA